MIAAYRAIKEKLDAYQPLAALGVNVYIRKAPARFPPPYIIIQMQTGTPEYAMDAAEQSTLYFQVKAIAKHGSDDIGDVLAIYINEAINNQFLLIKGHRLLRCWKTTWLEYPDPLVGEEYYHIGGLYTLKVA